MGRNQHEHSGQIQRAGRFIEELRDGHGKLKDWADMTEQNIKSLTGRQQNIHSKLDVHALEIHNAQADLHKAGKELEGTRNSLLGLNNDLGYTNVNVAKLSSCCDSHYKTLDGLSKGIKDTFRHVVAGEHGMLPPK